MLSALFSYSSNAPANSSLPTALEPAEQTGRQTSNLLRRKEEERRLVEEEKEKEEEEETGRLAGDVGCLSGGAV